MPYLFSRASASANTYAGRKSDNTQAHGSARDWASRIQLENLEAAQGQFRNFMPVGAHALLSLAHFCELHGPTSILCTQLSPVDCATCFPCPTPPSEDVSRESSYSSSFYEAPIAAGLQSLSLNSNPALLSPFDSPPTSPRSSGSNSSYNPYFPDQHAPPPRSHGSRGSMSRYSTSSETDTESCDNCSFIVPKAVSERLPEGAPGSPIKDGKGRNGSPVLRTTQPIIARGAPADGNEPRQGGDDEQKPVDKDEEDIPDPLTTASTPSSASESAASSPHYPPNCHTHMLTYVTTKQPTSQASYSFLRRACIRTLSNETLPKGSPSGPLYFGDPHAGYTIAYVFRVPDPRARGKRRIYALLALGGRDSWRVSKVMVKITRFFESIANQIIAMADRVLEKESAALQQPSGVTPTTPPLSSSLPSNDVGSPTSITGTERAIRSATTSPTTRHAQFSDVSSFLTAKRVGPDGYPTTRWGNQAPNNLAKIVGNENFFVDLHTRFCMMLSSLVKESVR